MLWTLTLEYIYKKYEQAFVSVHTTNKTPNIKTCTTVMFHKDDVPMSCFKVADGMKG